jgi:hypothetical protein
MPDTSGDNPRPLMRGLDPRIHRKVISSRRWIAGPSLAKPGNDEP